MWLYAHVATCKRPNGPFLFIINKILVIFNFINSVTIVLLCSFGLAIPCENCTCKLLVASLKLAVPLFTSLAIMLHKMAANFNGVSYEMLSDGFCAQNKCNLWSMFVISPFSMRVIKSSWIINFKSCNVLSLLGCKGESAIKHEPTYSATKDVHWNWMIPS